MAESSSDKQNIDEPNSVIQLLLDQFAIKRSILIIFKNTNIKFTSRLFDSLVLIIIFSLIFWEAGLFQLQLTTPMIIVVALAFFSIIEIVGANFPYFKRYFSNDEKSKIFLENIETRSTKEMQNFIKFHVFSPKYIDKILDMVKDDKNKIPPNIVEYILTTQDLTKSNMDKLLSFEVLPNININVIIDLLVKKTDQLTEKNVIAIYQIYKKNKDMLKILFATQQISNSLIDQYPDNLTFTDYYSKIYENREYLKGWIKYISFNSYKIILNIIHIVIVILLFLVFSFLLSLFYTGYPSPMQDPQQVIGNIIFIPIIIVLFLEAFAIKRLFSQMRQYYNKKLLSEINAYNIG
jgi:hypothetical protein